MYFSCIIFTPVKSAIAKKYISGNLRVQLCIIRNFLDFGFENRKVGKDKLKTRIPCRTESFAKSNILNCEFGTIQKEISRSRSIKNIKLNCILLRFYLSNILLKVLKERNDILGKSKNKIAMLVGKHLTATGKKIKNLIVCKIV